MTDPTTQRYHGEAIVKIPLAFDAYGPEDAEIRARKIVGSRSRILGSEIDSVHVRPMTVAQQLDYENLCLWQETEAMALGSSNQRQRWRDGCLPDEELLLIARGELFRPFSLIPRRSRKGPSAVRHSGDMSACAVDGAIPVRWAIDENPVMTEEEWSTLQRILIGCEQIRRHSWLRQSPPTCVRVVVRGHHGECLTCHGTTSEVGALVEIEWAGRPLTREYVL